MLAYDIRDKEVRRVFAIKGIRAKKKDCFVEPEWVKRTSVLWNGATVWFESVEPEKWWYSVGE